MLIEPDYAKRHRMFEFVPKSLDELVPRDHLLRRVEACIDFRSLVAPMAKYYDLGHGRPAVPPEVLVRALVIAYLYGIASFRKLCAAIHENISFRWFLFLGLEDEVFDHSTISVFLRRVGGNGFRGLLRRLNEQLRRNGLLSDEAFVDSTLVPAAVSCQANGLSPTTLSPEAFAKVAIEENGVFSTCEVLPEKGRQSRRLARRRLVRRWFQDARADCRFIRGIGTRDGARCPRADRPSSATNNTSLLIGRASSLPSASPTRRPRIRMQFLPCWPIRLFTSGFSPRTPVTARAVCGGT